MPKPIPDPYMNLPDHPEKHAFHDGIARGHLYGLSLAIETLRERSEELRVKGAVGGDALDLAALELEAQVRTARKRYEKRGLLLT